MVGFLWGFFKPLLYLMIFIVIFSQASNIQNFVLYATSGLIFWFFFSNVTNQSISSIISSAGIIKALNVPVIFFPLSEIISELFNFVLTLLVFLIAMNWFGLHYGPHLFLIIPLAVLFALFTLGLTLVMCALNVFFRDVGILWSTIQPAIFYLTPIAYPESLIATHYSFVVKFNPIYYFIKVAHTILHDGVAPAFYLWGYCTIIAAISMFAGFFIFNKLKNQFISSI